MKTIETTTIQQHTINTIETTTIYDEDDEVHNNLRSRQYRNSNRRSPQSLVRTHDRNYDLHKNYNLNRPRPRPQPCPVKYYQLLPTAITNYYHLLSPITASCYYRYGYHNRNQDRMTTKYAVNYSGAMKTPATTTRIKTAKMTTSSISLLLSRSLALSLDLTNSFSLREDLIRVSKSTLFKAPRSFFR